MRMEFRVMRFGQWDDSRLPAIELTGAHVVPQIRDTVRDESGVSYMVVKRCIDYSDDTVVIYME